MWWNVTLLDILVTLEQWSPHQPLASFSSVVERVGEAPIVSLLVAALVEPPDTSS